MKLDDVDIHEIFGIFSKFGTLSDGEIIEYLDRDDYYKISNAIIKGDNENGEVSLCDCGKGNYVFNEVKQELICSCGKRIKVV